MHHAATQDREYSLVNKTLTLSTGRSFVQIPVGEYSIYLDPETPFWFVPNPAAESLLSDLESVRCHVERGHGSEGLKQRNAAEYTIVDALVRSITVPVQPGYYGRKHRQLERLSELWFHLTDACNCTCRHCLFGNRSGPDATIPRNRVQALVDKGYELGARLICFTGGEPLMYPDFQSLLGQILVREDVRVAVLTNALLFPAKLRDIVSLDVSRLHFQVSLDGPRTLHDAIRGEGSFRKTCKALETMADNDIPCSVAMAVNQANVEHMSDVVKIVQNLGIDTIHYMWHFDRGRGTRLSGLPLSRLIANFRLAAAKARTLGVTIDNLEAMKAQVFSHPGTRFDFGNAAWESLAIGPDESVYPTPATVHLPGLRAGTAGDGLENVWRKSPLLEKIRHASLNDLPEMVEDPWRVIIGGGDLDHCVYLTGKTTDSMILRDDPYRPLYGEMARMVIEAELQGLPVPAQPGLILRMGDITTDCPSPRDVNFTHCNCLLSVGEGTNRTLVRDFYTTRAETPDALILNPIHYADDDTSFIPDEAKARIYGCGSPVADAELQPGETLVDLGSGTGVECFLAAREVGPRGRSIGIDMTDAMLEIAQRAQIHVSRQLGYENAEFYKGFLEELPLSNEMADTIISNCVVNLSHNKRRVFSEIFRVLKPGGRMVISDVVSESEPPLAVRGDHQLIGECIGGALVQDYLFGLLNDVGFVNAEIIKRFPYREVHGHRFYSITFRAYKPRQAEYAKVIYSGPFRSVVTDDGTVLHKGLLTDMDLGPGWDKDRLALCGVLTVDKVSGEITNVDAESSCACFIPQPPAAIAGHQPKPETGCLICGEPLLYGARSVEATCALCGRTSYARASCTKGHYVCDACHIQEPVEVTKYLCLNSDETDMFQLFDRIVSHPTFPLHGPEYHSLVPGVILATYRNLGGPISNERILEGIDRGTMVPGGACAFLGVCGAASGVGIALSVMLESNPLQAKSRQIVQRIVSETLAEIASVRAARCCRRESHHAFRVAARESDRLLPIALQAEQWHSCQQHQQNKECIKQSCPFFDRPGP